MSPLLALLLLLPQSAVDVSEGVTISRVRLDLPEADVPRFQAFLEVHSGDTLSRAKIRHTVQLLYATGAFEDVRVEAEPGGAGGVEVVFRPTWAPLLKNVRVSGDSVLSAGAVRKIARLRVGEPLWPTRLEKARKDIEAALTSLGYLEARVEATSARKERSADAVFAVHSGPRILVSRADLAGAEQDAVVLKGMIRPRAGEPFRKEEADKAAEKMRRHLVDLGRWAARVEHQETYDAQAGRIAVAFSVSPGPATNVDVRGARISGALRAALEGVLRDGGMKADAVEEAAGRLEEDFLSRGYREVAIDHAEETPPGREILVFTVRAGPEARVASVRVTGAEEAAFREPVLATRPGTPLEDRLADQDARLLTRALLESGYASARVDPEVPEGGGDLPVVFRAVPGPRTLVSDLTIDAAPPPPGVTFENLRVKKGRPYRERDLALDAKDLATAYENGGYRRAEVHPEVAFSEDRTEVAVTIRALPGPLTTLDHLLITGLQQTKETVVRRELLIKEGDPLGLQKVLESQRRISSLGIFSRASISEVDPESIEKRSLAVHVEEAPLTTIAYGVGYAERDLLRGSVEVTRRDLGGLDRSLSLFVRGSFAGNRVLLTYREPYPLGRKGEIFVTTYHEEEELDSFSYTRTGATVQTARSFSSHTSLVARYTFEKTNVFNVLVPLDQVDREFRNSTFSGPAVSIVNDSRDDPLDPSRGHFVVADTQFSSNAFGGNSFIKGFLQTSYYHPLVPRTLLALSARVGLARTFNGEPSELPLPDRFFAGGDYSIRGFAIDTAGPLAPSSTGGLLPTGGNALLVGSAEVRIDTGGHFQVALFTDLGNVYPLVSEMSLSDILYTAGVGLRYKSPFGPLRVDYGYKLNRRPGDSPGHVHITVGYAF
jgi:outer membrane protein insertion porin family